MNTRQRKKIIDLYYMDTDQEMLLPPSVVRAEERNLMIYESKAWRISHPEEAKKHDEALKKALDELEKEAKSEQ